MIVLDTTVLVYATGTNHPLREPCRQIMEAVADGRIAASTTTEVLQEFTHVRARRRTRKDAVRLTKAYADLLSPLITVEEKHLRAGLSVFERHPKLGAFDSVLAATASFIGADALVSADRAFAVLDFPRHVIPDERGVELLMSRR
jgi:predicted nucleic acid-binding protein